MGTETISSSPIRILLANLSGIMRQMIANLIQAQPDMVLVGEVDGQIEVLYAALKGVDIVIIGSSQLYPPPGLCSHLLNEFPELKILVYAARESAASGFWLDIRRCYIKDASGGKLVDSLRNLHLIKPSL